MIFLLNLWKLLSNKEEAENVQWIRNAGTVSQGSCDGSPSRAAHGDSRTALGELSGGNTSGNGSDRHCHEHARVHGKHANALSQDRGKDREMGSWSCGPDLGGGGHGLLTDSAPGDATRFLRASWLFFS